MPYIALKHLHVTFVALSGLLFLVRGIWMLRASPNLEQRWARIVPHIVDTLLLASAIGLAVVSHQYPGQMPWLTAKVVGLVAYIVLGTSAAGPRACAPRLLWGHWPASPISWRWRSRRIRCSSCK